jgi:hypothetical protein
MSAVDEVAARIVARQLRHAVLVRRTSAVAPDPAITFGVAVLKVVSEEQVQAIAYGPLDLPPHVIVRRDPLSRDASDLTDFATYLASIADRAVVSHDPIRLWVGHDSAIECLDVLGHRYRTNPSATPELQRMGSICRTLAKEASYPGQQTVVNAASALRAHSVTGLAPTEESHLHALLAWHDAAVTDPLKEARSRIRLPASGVLVNTPDQPLDDKVDRLRRVAKAGGAGAAAATAEIERILREGGLREWSLLVEAHAAFRRLGLPDLGLDALVDASKERVLYALEHGFFPSRSPERLAIALEEMECGQSQASMLDVENDLGVRDSARKAGTVVAGTISRVDQPRRRCRPCTIEVESAQNSVRCRRDDKVRVLGSNVCGVVRGIESVGAGGTRVRVEITSGFRTTAVLTRGHAVDLAEEAYGYVARDKYFAVKDRQPWIFYGTAAPALVAAAPPARTPLELAAARRRT